MLRSSLCTALLLLAGCARSEDARDTQTRNAPLPTLNTSDLGEEDELSIGSWQTGLQDNQQVLEFGPAGAAARFSLNCDARRNLVLQWPGAAPSGDLPRMLVTIGSETRQFPLASGGTANPVLRATLSANDPFMRVLTVATARIFVRVGDAQAQPLVMPPSPAIAVYARQCTSGEVQVNPAAGNTVETTGSVNVVAGNVATDTN